MPIDVSGSSRPRQPDPLSDSDRARLQTLAGKGDRTPAEGYELGSLKARARHDPGSRRVLEDLTHQTPPPQQQRQQQKDRPATDRQRNLDMLREHMRDWS